VVFVVQVLASGSTLPLCMIAAERGVARNSNPNAKAFT
jgi:hypothetical protein